MPSPAAQERVRLLNIRLAMIARCHDPRNPQFKDYGGRGIAVCQRWRDSPDAFIRDIGPRPAGMTLDRIDNDRGYEPDNLRWASRAEQQRNRRNNILVVVGGREMVLTDAAAEAGLSFNAVRKRMLRGWTIEDALSVPATRANRGSPRGKIGAAC